MAIRWYAIGIDAARSGDAVIAEKARAELGSLRTPIEESGAKYWLALLDAQIKGIEAWLAFANGNSGDAVGLMREAADV